jgi:hypothetical protein
MTMATDHRTWDHDAMIADALAAHDAHCGGTCSTAIKLTAQLGKGGIVQHGHELQGPLPMRGGGRQGHGRTVRSNLASPAQHDLIRRLAAERDYLSLGLNQRTIVQAVCEGQKITWQSARDLIDALKATVRADSTSMRPEFLPKPQPKAERVELTDDALYLKDGKVIHVKRSGRGFQYGEIYNEATSRWDYVKGALAGVTGDHRMTLEQANEISIRISRCVRCRRTLTAEESVSRGVGPVCASKF